MAEWTITFRHITPTWWCRPWKTRIRIFLYRPPDFFARSIGIKLDDFAPLHHQSVHAAVAEPEVTKKGKETAGDDADAKKGDAKKGDAKKGDAKKPETKKA